MVTKNYVPYIPYTIPYSDKFLHVHLFAVLGFYALYILVVNFAIHDDFFAW